MSSSLYRDNHQNSAPTPGNGSTDAPTKTLTHYGANFTPLSEHATPSTSDTWPTTYDAGYSGPKNTAQPSLAGLSNKDTPS